VPLKLWADPTWHGELVVLMLKVAQNQSLMADYPTQLKDVLI
jgi:hypothetical protein